MGQELLEYISNESSIFLYRGSFLNKPSLSISSIVEDNLTSKFSRKIKNRTLFLLIEITQNIEKYSEHHIDFKDMFLVSNVKNGIIIQSENTIKNSNLEVLKDRLEKISESSRDELNKLFTSTLTKSLEVNKKSPGLGLIEMKRKNRRAFRYEFKEINEEYSTFSITLFISEHEDQDGAEEINEIDKIKNVLNYNSDIIIYAGSFESAVVSSITKLIEKLELCDDRTITSKYQHTIIEKIQNAKEHGFKENDNILGYFSLKKNNDSITSVCCNRAENTDKLNEKIVSLNKKSEEELKELIKSIMLDFEQDGGLGLAQVAKYSRPSPLISKTFYNAKKETFFYLSSKYS